ncbi:MAG: germination protein YpeB [Oscillospiraceae bacterium]|nr:germination protein YpeB [Oscillospiraceae bacterium]
MLFEISRRGLVRVISFSLALIFVLAAANFVYMNKIEKMGYVIESGYREAVEELAASADKISSALTKGKYSNDAAMMARLSSELITSADTAKEALLKLPVSSIDLEGTNKFLSQVGNYAYSLSEKAARGDAHEISDTDNLNALSDAATEFSKALWELKGKILSQDEDLSEIFDDLEDFKFLEDLTNLESGFDEMPKLIYDGPYSDHILEKTPKMTEGAKEISAEDAAEKAAKLLNLEAWELKASETGEEGKMPSYCFWSENGYAAVTKQGGYLNYMIKSRNVLDDEIENKEALRLARLYLESLGIENMQSTYYEEYNNVLCVNFAYTDGDVICYTDLIKVSVALDNGEILGFDARGFIVNHYDRDLPEPTISQVEAQQKLSPFLSVTSTQLALIPSDSVEEKLCWEFKCQSDDDEAILVYINAQTGEEEDILILLISDDGTLTV